MPKFCGLGQPIVDKLYHVQDSDMEFLGIEKKGGSILFQTSDDFHKFEKKLSQLTHDVRIVPGGSCGNTLKAVASLGINCALIGKVGNDKMAQLYVDSMSQRGVFAKTCASDTPTGECICLVTPDGERTMRVYLGASSDMSAEDLNLDGLDDVEIFHLEGYALYNQPLALKYLKLAKEKGKKVSYDLGSFELVRSFKELILNTVLTYVDIVFCNEEESKQFADTPSEAVDILASKCEIAIVMMGSKGCMIKSGDKKFIVSVDPLKSHEVIDSTGAGDLFCGGFLYAFMRGYPLEVCGNFGCLSGKEVCLVMGAEIAMEKWHLIKESGIKQLIK